MQLDLDGQSREELRALLEVSRSVLAQSIGQLSSQFVSGSLPPDQAASLKAERMRADALVDAARRFLAMIETEAA